jgi:hypothetical protein
LKNLQPNTNESIQSVEEDRAGSNAKEPPKSLHPETSNWQGAAPVDDPTCPGKHALRFVRREKFSDPLVKLFRIKRDMDFVVLNPDLWPFADQDLPTQW